MIFAALSKTDLGYTVGKYLSASMALVSFGLLFVLTLLGAPCPFCLVSAFCSVIIFVSWWGREGMAKRTGGLAALGLAGGFVWTSLVDGGGEIRRGAKRRPYTAYHITMTNNILLFASLRFASLLAVPSPTPAPAYADTNAASIVRGGGAATKAPQVLLNDLKSLDTKLYGAFWCSHCAEQKETLGKEWQKYVQYVECDKEGQNYKGQCKIDGQKLKGYPTWTIDGIKIEGERSIEELEEIVEVIKKGGSTKNL